MNIENTEACLSAIFDKLKDIDDKLAKLGKWSKGKTTVNGELLMDNQELCLLLKISKRSLQRIRNSGKLPYQMIRNKVYYLESDVYTFIKDSFAESRKNKIND